MNDQKAVTYKMYFLCYRWGLVNCSMIQKSISKLFLLLLSVIFVQTHIKVFLGKALLFVTLFIVCPEMFFIERIDEIKRRAAGAAFGPYKNYIENILDHFS